MRIGLVRHYKVLKDLPKGKSLYTGEDVSNWFREYDLTDIEYAEEPIDVQGWDCCYASTLPRALNTAKHIYSGKIIERDELREIVPPIFKTKMKLPFIGWGILVRFSHIFNQETRREIAKSREKVKLILDEIEAGDSKEVLIVSHAALMVYIRKELISRGYIGPKFSIANNGELYVFEK